MFSQGQHRAERGWVAFGFIGCHARRRHATPFKGVLKEGAGGCAVAPIAEIDVNDLPMFINGPKDIPPTCVNLQVGFIYPPALTNRRAVGTCRGDEAWREGLEPIVDGAGIDGDAALGQPLLFWLLTPSAVVQRTSG